MEKIKSKLNLVFKYLKKIENCIKLENKFEYNIKSLQTHQ